MKKSLISVLFLFLIFIALSPACVVLFADDMNKDQYIVKEQQLDSFYNMYRVNTNIYIDLKNSITNGYRMTQRIGPQSYRRNYLLAKIHEVFEKKIDAFLYYQKALFFYKLELSGQCMPDYLVGMDDLSFDNVFGEIGYIELVIPLNKQVPYMKNTLPISKRSLVLYKEIDFDNDILVLRNQLPITTDRYIISGFKLLTAFPDTKKNIYRLYYRVKYADNDV